jgi:hypothetical protein
MSSPTAHTQLTIHIPGCLMTTPNQLQLRGGSQFTMWQGIPDQQTPSGNKENTPIVSLGGGDVHHTAALRRQAIMSPEIQGLEMPKVVKDVFYGKKVNFMHYLYVNYHYIRLGPTCTNLCGSC